LFLDDKVGSIEVGKEADIAVWDRDMYTVPAADLKNLKCEMTLFSGQIVYKAAATPITEKIPAQQGVGAEPRRCGPFFGSGATPKNRYCSVIFMRFAFAPCILKYVTFAGGGHRRRCKIIWSWASTSVVQK